MMVRLASAIQLASCGVKSEEAWLLHSGRHSSGKPAAAQHRLWSLPSKHNTQSSPTLVIIGYVHRHHGQSLTHIVVPLIIYTYSEQSCMYTTQLSFPHTTNKIVSHTYHKHSHHLHIQHTHSHILQSITHMTNMST